MVTVGTFVLAQIANGYPRVLLKSDTSDGLAYRTPRTIMVWNEVASLCRSLVCGVTRHLFLGESMF